MTFKSRFQSWLCVALSCVLSAAMPLSPMVQSMLSEEMQLEESVPADASDEIEVGEVVLSESTFGQRRLRREKSVARTTLSTNHRECHEQPVCRNVAERLTGQGSLGGRSGPLHC